MTVEKLDDRRTDVPAPAGDGGGTTDARLRALEMQMVRLHEGFKRLEDALKRYEDEMKSHFATKAWVLGTMLGGIAVAAAVAGAIVKLFP